ncbi:M20/M25/M40 family metallo-hydrolase [Rhodohalobacter halophilus]|uniref:M20/M25/M40 family metallo-hydrolase n=1 Tax=Rhodohalobacter halophilus TaxID=1812810 RepID=UPI00083FD84A|nr:M20/M25/M40 family metallo-hydrolase [Rhodohalobacter halophilus]
MTLYPARLFWIIFSTLIFTLSCSSTQTVEAPSEITTDSFPFEASSAFDRLSRAIQIETVSLENEDEIDFAPYEEFKSFLSENYPALHANTEIHYINKYTILIEWRGSNEELKPGLFIGHYDVVPVKEDAVEFWSFAPFGGEQAEGFIWGRGALDDKAGILSVVEAAEYLIRSGHENERSFFIALHHDEEIGGLNGAARVSQFLESRDIEVEFLMDEGPPVAENIIDNIDVPLAMIGVAEKGSLNLELVYRQEGGHSSMPPRQTVISTLSRAINRIEQRPMKAHYRGLITETFEPLIPYMSFTQRLAFNNTWLFSGKIKRELGKNPATNAALRTTAAKTIFEAGFKENVLPVEGRVIINFRLHPNDTIDDVIAYVRRRIDNPDIQINVMDRARNPSPVSDTRAAPYSMLKQTIQEIFDQALVSPSLFVAASDSRHFHNLTENIYRFRPIRATHDDRARVHGIDERIRKENYLEMIQFQIQLMQNLSGPL